VAIKCCNHRVVHKIQRNLADLLHTMVKEHIIAILLSSRRKNKRLGSYKLEPL
jgi:cytochrome b